MIVDPRIETYIRGLIPKQSETLEMLKEYAANYLVPIVHPEVGTLLNVLCRIHRPKRILEIGTAIGYSALLMDEACLFQAEIHTLELNSEMVKLARQHINEANASERITVFEGDASETLKGLTGTYDLIFIDAAKGQYLVYLQHCYALMHPGTVLISDNVLFQGMVASNTLLVRRKITLVKRLRQYLETLMHHEYMESTVIPIADGVAVSIWKGKSGTCKEQ